MVLRTQRTHQEIQCLPCAAFFFNEIHSIVNKTLALIENNSNLICRGDPRLFPETHLHIQFWNNVSPSTIIFGQHHIFNNNTWKLMGTVFQNTLAFQHYSFILWAIFLDCWIIMHTKNFLLLLFSFLNTN